jgi:protein TonB
MDTNKILTADVLDIVFEGRNKSYGAYDLRKTYSSRLKKALLITGLAVAGIVASAAVFNNSKTSLSQQLDNEGVKITEVVMPEEEKKPEPIPEEQKPQEQPQQQLVEQLQLKTIMSTTPVIVDNDQVKDPPPTQDDLKNFKIDLKTNANGISDIGLANPAKILDNGTGIIPEKKNPEPEIWEKVEIEASFEGGPKAWESFLRRNLDADVPPNNGAPEGKYTVIVQFVVDENGAVSDLKPLTQHGFGMEQEALRVLRKASKWKPAQQNGRLVKAYRRQPITFEVAQN